MDRDEIRRWYNGYNWTGAAVYNPFDVLLLFQKREFRTWWFETGTTPTFLIDQLTERGFFTPRLAGLLADEALLSAFDVDCLAPEALLWQTGYLTSVAGPADPPDRHRVQQGPADPGRVRGGDRLTGMGSPIRSASARRVGESPGAGQGRSGIPSCLNRS